MKFFKKLLFFVLLIFTSFGLSGCYSLFFSPMPFDDYMDNLFVQIISDPLNANFYIKDKEALGIGDLEVTPMEFSEDSFNMSIDYIKYQISILKSYDYESLTPQQQITYDIVMDFFNKRVAEDGFYYYDSPLGSYLGYQAQLPLILGEYHFYSKNDIELYLDYLTTTRDTFENIVAFENERASKGFGKANYVLDGIIAQCDNFANDNGSSLKTSFEEKIDALTYLTSQEKANYKALNARYLQNEFVPAYEYLSEEMAKLKNKAVNDKGLFYFENGKKYYELLFKDATGTDMSVDDAYQELNTLLNEEKSKLQAIFNKNSSTFETIYSPNFLDTKTYQEALDFFLNNYKNDFVNLGDVNVRFENISASLEDYSSPAMYFISPLDADVEEVIYINNSIFAEDPTYAFITLAHEGVPGHLLQHQVLKNSDLPNIRKVMDYVSYSEGWATYAEEYIGKYIQNKNQELIDAYFINDRMSYILLGICDIGVNYKGWTKAQFTNYINQYFDLSSEAIDKTYYQLIEEPTNVLEYYFSYYQIIDLKEKFKDDAKNKNISNLDYEFHKFYLEMGPAPFYIMEDKMDDYINSLATN